MKTGLAQQIKRAPLERQAAAALRAKVLSGEFPPGYRLVEMWLADQFELSRGTVRAALSQLVHEGLVEQVAYTRWAVPKLSAKDAWELYTLRSSLEGLAARLVTTSMTPEKAAELTAALRRIKDAADRDDRAGVDEHDAALHSLIVKLADHRRLQQQYTIIEQQARRYIACSNALTVDCAAILKQHEPIVQALISGDPDLAEREAQRHNLEEGELLAANLQSQEAQPGADAVRDPSGIGG